MTRKPAFESIAQLWRGLLSCWLLLVFSSAGFADDTMPVGAPKQVPEKVPEQDNTSQSMQLNGEPPRMHPANLALRFGLEVAALTAMGAWGLDQADGVARFGLMVGVPAAAAAAWGTFTVPEDPSRRGGKGAVTVPGLVRLGVEFAVFGFATWAMWDMGQADLAGGYAATTAVHYAISLKRIRWLLRR